MTLAASQSARSTDPLAARVAAIRAALAAAGLDGLLIPRADRHLGEWTPASEERLTFATGFTGSAGLAALLSTRGALFVDARYTVQARGETDLALYEPVATATTKATDWLAAALAPGARLGVDPWLHGADELERLEAACAKAEARLVRLEANPIDAVWADRPAPPSRPARPHPAAFSGHAPGAKREAIAAALAAEGFDACVLTAPESVAWLLDLRGEDLPTLPVLRAFALLGADGAATLFCAPAALDAATRAHLGPRVAVRPFEELSQTLAALAGARVALDRTQAPAAVAAALEAAGARVVWREDPTLGPKARKNVVEIAGARAAQIRDGAALVRVLAALDRAPADGRLRETDVARMLTEARAAEADADGLAWLGPSFEPIVGFGPNGAIVHYRPRDGADRALEGRGLLLIDSGGQYPDGTTDVTRTVALGGLPTPAERAAATLVLLGLIAMSRLVFPPKTAGRDIEGVARAALWAAGLDFDHGVGHGVGSCLGVHEGPHGLSRRSMAALEPGVILSNEPGYYREGGFGLRLENLMLVIERPAPAPVAEGLAPERPMLGFETLTRAPFDRRLIDVARLDATARAWLDAYHAEVLALLAPRLEAEDRAWLEAACAPL